jgi:hypothetical protein
LIVVFLVLIASKPSSIFLNCLFLLIYINYINKIN